MEQTAAKQCQRIFKRVEPDGPKNNFSPEVRIYLKSGRRRAGSNFPLLPLTGDFNAFPHFKEIR